MLAKDITHSKNLIKCTNKLLMCKTSEPFLKNLLEAGSSIFSDSLPSSIYLGSQRAMFMWVISADKLPLRSWNRNF